MSTSDGLPTGSEREREGWDVTDKLDWLGRMNGRPGIRDLANEAATEIRRLRAALAVKREPERDSIIVRLCPPPYSTDTVQAFADAVIADGVNAGIEIGHVLERIRAVSFTFPWANRYEVAQWLLGRALVDRLETNHRIVFDGLAASPPEASEEAEDPTVPPRFPSWDAYDEHFTCPVPPVEPEGDER